MDSISITAEKRTYPVIFEACKGSFLVDFLAPLAYKKVLILTDENVAKFHLETVKLALSKAQVHILILQPGEQNKSLKQVSAIYELLLEKGFFREDAILALGGGVIGDLAGFCAATFLRGIHFYLMPTSLLAQIDSSIGGKTGVNFGGAKNMVGAFYPPHGVYIGRYFLETLPQKEYVNGLSEMIKMALISDKDMVQTLKNPEAIWTHLEALVRQSILLKRDFVVADEQEKNKRMCLNFGHTIGHAIEMVHGLRHGEAVSLGMVCALQMGNDLGVHGPDVVKTGIGLLEGANLPTTVKPYLTPPVLRMIEKDKKIRGNKIHLVLLRQIGEAMLYEIDISTFFEVMSCSGLMAEI